MTATATAIRLGRDQRRVVYGALDWIRKDYQRETGRAIYWTVVLEWCCLHSIDLIDSPDLLSLAMSTPENADHLFRYCPHQDQKPIISLALESAASRIGLDDRGSALTYICSIYILTAIPDDGELQRRKWRGLRKVRRELLDLLAGSSEDSPAGGGTPLSDSADQNGAQPDSSGGLEIRPTVLGGTGSPARGRGASESGRAPDPTTPERDPTESTRDIRSICESTSRSSHKDLFRRHYRPAAEDREHVRAHASHNHAHEPEEGQTRGYQPSTSTAHGRDGAAGRAGGVGSERSERLAWPPPTPAASEAVTPPGRGSSIAGQPRRVHVDQPPGEPRRDPPTPTPGANITTAAELAAALGVPEDELCELAASVEQHYKPPWPTRRRKKSGRRRWIDEPRARLMVVQKLINGLLAPLIDSPIAYGIPGRSHVDAARVHEGQNFVGKHDIPDFFTSIVVDRVRSALRDAGFSGEALELLVALVTLNGRLRQGPPSSPVIANLVLAELDRQFAEKADRLCVNATRTSDDITASGPTWIAVRRFLQFVEDQLRELGLRVNWGKYSITPHRRAQLVHGGTVNRTTSIPKKKSTAKKKLSRERLRDDVRRARRYGCTDKQWEKATGQIGYIKPLHPKRAGALGRELKRRRI